MWMDVMNNLLLWRRGKIALLLLLLMIIKMLQILRNIVRGHVHVRVPIPFSPYIAARFAAVAVAVAARRRYRAP
jgi:hypothetical protein